MHYLLKYYCVNKLNPLAGASTDCESKFTPSLQARHSMPNTASYSDSLLKQDHSSLTSRRPPSSNAKNVCTGSQTLKNNIPQYH
jgi:hypothetical protein